MSSSPRIPLYSALLDLRVAYDRCLNYLNLVLQDEIREVTFRWDGSDIMYFDVVLAPMPLQRSERTDLLNGIFFRTRTVTGSFSKDAVRYALGPEAESILMSMSVLHTLNDALLELDLPLTDFTIEKPHHLSFSARSFEARPVLHMFKALHDNWNNYDETCANGHHHYQARMNTKRGLLHLTPGPLDFLTERDEGADEQAPWGNN